MNENTRTTLFEVLNGEKVPNNGAKRIIYEETILEFSSSLKRGEGPQQKTKHTIFRRGQLRTVVPVVLFIIFLMILEISQKYEHSPAQRQLTAALVQPNAYKNI
jgi:hypothetical protein